MVHFVTCSQLPVKRRGLFKFRIRTISPSSSPKIELRGLYLILTELTTSRVTECPAIVVLIFRLALLQVMTHFMHRKVTSDSELSGKKDRGYAGPSPSFCSSRRSTS